MTKFTGTYITKMDRASYLLPPPGRKLVQECLTEIRRLKGLMVFFEPDGTATPCTEEEWIAKRKAAAATIGKLHKTKDGVSVVPHVDAVYRCMHQNRGKFHWQHGLATTAKHLTECSYFSLRAAEASGELETHEKELKERG